MKLGASSVPQQRSQLLGRGVEELVDKKKQVEKQVDDKDPTSNDIKV